MACWDILEIPEREQDICGITAAEPIPEYAVQVLETIFRDKKYDTVPQKLAAIKIALPRLQPEAVLNYLDHCMQMRVKEEHRKVASRSHTFYLRYLSNLKTKADSNKILLHLGYKEMLPPSLLTRFILQEYIRINELSFEKMDIRMQTKYSGNSTCLEEEGDLETSKRRDLDKMMMEEPGLIPDAQLRLSVSAGVCEDDWSGPAHDTERHYLGQMYESLLFDVLKAHNVAFLCEDDQRQRHLLNKCTGKTPDVLLMDELAYEGQPIRWIDSKAMFCTRLMHSDIMKKQLTEYCKRFGPGLVVYWLGHEAGLRYCVAESSGHDMGDVKPGTSSTGVTKLDASKGCDRAETRTVKVGRAETSDTNSDSSKRTGTKTSDAKSGVSVDTGIFKLSFSEISGTEAVSGAHSRDKMDTAKPGVTAANVIKVGRSARKGAKAEGPKPGIAKSGCTGSKVTKSVDIKTDNSERNRTKSGVPSSDTRFDTKSDNIHVVHSTVKTRDEDGGSEQVLVRSRIPQVLQKRRPQEHQATHPNNFRFKGAYRYGIALEAALTDLLTAN